MADHTYTLGARVREPMPDDWHRRWAICARCGDTRKVYHAIDLTHLNYVLGPCPHGPRIIRRWRQRR